MKFTVLHKDISQVLSRCVRLSQNKAQLPILSNVIFKTNKNKVEFQVTNLEMALSAKIGARIEREGSLAVPSKIIYELINNSESDQISFESEKETLSVEGNNFSSTISCMNPQGFPSIPVSVSKNKLVIKTDLLKDVLKKTLFAVSFDETRPNLTGVLFSLSKTKLSLVSTDGFRLARHNLQIKSQTVVDFVVPRNVLVEVLKIESEELAISYSEVDKQVLFGYDDTVLSSRLINGEFPNYKRIIPGEFKLAFLVDRNEFHSAVKLASVFAKDSANALKITINKDEMTVESESKTSGRNKSSVAIKHTKSSSENGLEIVFNYKFVDEFLMSSDSETISVSLNDNESPVVFEDPTNKDYLYLAMPIRN